MSRRWAYNMCKSGKSSRCLSLFCDGVAQTCHDGRVVELKELLVVEEVVGEKSGRKSKGRKEKSYQRNCVMMMTMDECEMNSELESKKCEMTSSSVEECASRARSTHGVQHEIVEINIVIDVVLGELHVGARVHISLFFLMIL